jgi:hypothetical protein
MKQYPAIQTVETAPAELFDGGHLWLLELLDGAHLRFQLQSSGLIRFGDRTRIFHDPDDIPPQYDHAVSHIQEHLDREALRAAVDDVEDVVFFGEAMHRQAIDYDWSRTPSFLGFDVWSVADGEFRPPDAVNSIFDRLGLQPVNALEREVRARDFDPESYSIPDSAWYDGPAAGVVIRNKSGNRAKLLHPEYDPIADFEIEDVSAEELATEVATSERFDRLESSIEARNAQVTFDRLYDAILADATRAHHQRIYSDEVDTKRFRSELAERTRAYLTE